jgi:hypothetical protein
MANAARDPYWQASVRREALEHAPAAAAIESECATCHMPLQHAADKAAAHETPVFSRLPLLPAHEQDVAAADGVTCSVCHQAEPTGLGTPASYNGNLVIAASGAATRPLFGPLPAEPRIVAIHKATSGLDLAESPHLRESGLCGSCHTLSTTTLDAAGKPVGSFPEQMPYLEWLASDFHDKQTCQSCHMPAVDEPAPIATLGSPARQGTRRHSFPGANFLLANLLDAHRDDLGTVATSAELSAAADEARTYLTSQAARISVSAPAVATGKLTFAVTVQNLAGHKLPTAFPSRRAWLHVIVADAAGRVVFESGHLNPDGSITGNLNDADPARFSPHYTSITAASQVQIFEPILGDAQGHVTTALLTATHYLKDNRILPAGFDKKTAPSEIAVQGAAAADPAFTAGSATTRYAIPLSAAGQLHVTVELLYQPIGYRWAHNFDSIQAPEPQRFAGYYKAAADHSAHILARAEQSTH